MNEQRAVIQQMVDALDHADELLGGNDTLVMNGAAAGRWLLEQPAVQEPVAPKPWVGLTDEEKASLANSVDYDEYYLLVENVEAKLKAKNERKEKNNA